MGRERAVMGPAGGALADWAELERSALLLTGAAPGMAAAKAIAIGSRRALGSVDDIFLWGLRHRPSGRAL